ncbi:MAG: glycosyltransferase family 4 protein [Candidatus Rokubacteria bacterium]|nr:glycosyltransferase family 4 protein [Candidatus Rokubacteria bacterium]
MRLLYLSYWSLDEGLTQATVLPHLDVLRSSPRISHIEFVTVERDDVAPFAPSFGAARLRHVALRANRVRPAVVGRGLDFLTLPRALVRLCDGQAIDYILARGVHAGALAHLVHRRRPIPYAVESFEPHSIYMRESRVWSVRDPRYLLQRHWEAAQKREATALLPVSGAYHDALLAEGIAPTRIVTVPCTVDAEQFRFSATARAEERRRLRIDDSAVVGIYVGKFGDTYYAAEAFAVFARFARAFPGFRMLVLSPTPRPALEALAREGGYPPEAMTATTVAHRDVPRYLSAADVAFATVRSVPSRLYCSPVKVGEYWASGLPVVITEGVGDDSRIVREHDAGAVFDLTPSSLAAAVDRVRVVLADAGHRARIAGLAERYRARARVREGYEQLGLA